MNWISHFAERNHDEVAEVHEGMGDFEEGIIDVEVVVEEDVDIDDAVVVDASFWLVGAPHGTLDALGGCQQGDWGEGGVARHHGIEKEIVGLETPGLWRMKSRLAHNVPNQLFNTIDGAAEVGLPVAEVGA